MEAGLLVNHATRPAFVAALYEGARAFVLAVQADLIHFGQLGEANCWYTA